MSEGSRERLPIGLEATEISERELPLDGAHPESDPTLMGVGAPANATAPTVASGGGELQPGEHVGRYVIERKVGAGGMGEVYAAHDPQLDRRVAIKVLRPTGRATDAAARLVREAQALAKLAHPNVVAVHDVGEADGRVFLAMQFVEGTTLGEHIARTALAADEIVRLYVAAGRGLAAAHAAGLIHRDMKPSNVLIDRDGHVAVTDFGVARASDDFATPEPHAPSWSGPNQSGTGRSALSTDMTQAGAMIGTPSYMAPEQHAGKRATAKSDQFGFCVSLWQGLLGKHPFVPDDHDEVTTPFEYMALISEGVLIPPRAHRTPGGDGISRRVIAAMTRGLAKDPDARWPSMTALIAELEPKSSYRTAVVALAAVATVGAGAALWFALAGHGAEGSSCRTSTGERVKTAWTGARAAAIRDGFARSGRPYAAASAKAAAAALDQYAQRWSALAVDACAGASTGGADVAGAQLVQARAQCLDRRLGALRSVVTLLADAPRAELVDGALAIVSGLPSLDDCVDPAGLLADGAPPADRKVAVAAIEDRLATARANLDAGLFREARPVIEALVPEADAQGWPSLQIRTRQALGELELTMFGPATPPLLEAARLATEHGLDREAARAWSVLVSAAGNDRKADAFEAYSEIAGAMIGKLHDPVLVNQLRMLRGRGLTRMRRYPEAEPLCRAALAEARTRAGVKWPELQLARDCLLEAVVPIGKWDEARTLAEESMADRVRQVSADHPAIADYLEVIAKAKQNTGKIAEAKADYEHARDIRLRVYGPDHMRYAESLQELAPFERDLDKRKAQLEHALAIVVAPANQGPRTMFVEYSLESGLGALAGQQDDQAAMQRHFDRALVLAEQLAGPVSLDVGLLLVGYGQFMSRVDLDQSLAKLRRAAEILDALHDHRAEVARAALALMLMHEERYAEALPVLERALAAIDLQQTEPSNLALMRFNLADALVHTDGDHARAVELAGQALATFRTLGPDFEYSTKRATAFLKKYRKRPR